MKLTMFRSLFFCGLFFALTVCAAGQAFEEKNSNRSQSAELEQCGNGSFTTPEPCSGANWVIGNTDRSSTHWWEGNSVPYRVKFGGLRTGVPSTFSFGWDTTRSAKYAFDHITSYDRSEKARSGNDPCSDIIPACGTMSTFPIPVDPSAASLGIAQIPGVLTMWGATITSVSTHTVEGDYAGDSSTRITITFTPTVSNPVLAWGGHLAERSDTLGRTASDIPGSPYRMRALELNGSAIKQERTISSLAIGQDSVIRIIKQASPESAQVFGFTTTGTGLMNFTLVDDGVDNDPTPNSIMFNNLLAPGGSGSFSVTETSNGQYDVTNITCAVTGTAGSSTAPNIPLSRVTITLQYSDTVTCTFFNSITVAAPVSVSGRIVTASGRGISRAVVSVVDLSSGEARTAVSNGFGYYSVEGMVAGGLYMISVQHKQYVFESRIVTLSDSLDDFDFIGN